MIIELKTLCVFGSRTLKGKKVEKIIDDFIKNSEYNCLITSLDTRGVCEVARNYAKINKSGICLLAIGLDAKRCAGMYEARSIKALKMADHLLAIWDKKSKGTQNEIKLAEKLGIKTTIIEMDVDEYEFYFDEDPFTFVDCLVELKK